jgi:hypothetical protein
MPELKLGPTYAVVESVRWSCGVGTQLWRRGFSPADQNDMEIADVRKRIKDAIERSRRQAADRRARNSEANVAYERFLSGIAVPLCQQVAGALKAEGYPFIVNTPAGAVRLASERWPDDFIEIQLDTTGPRPQVVARVERIKGRETIAEDRPVKPGTLIEHLSDQDVLDVLAEALAVFVEK